MRLLKMLPVSVSRFLCFDRRSAFPFFGFDKVSNDTKVSIIISFTVWRIVDGTVYLRSMSSFH
jgi:hypothetical protein